MTNEYACSEERFLRDVQDHNMTVIRMHGADRHLRLRAPANPAYWFDIVTWRGVLCIHGDCGTYVFSRLEDMFEFFRSAAGRINPSYWAEKVQAADRAGVEAFEWDTFVDDVKAYFDQAWLLEAPSDDADAIERQEFDEHCERRQDCWHALDEALGNCEPDEYGAAQIIRDFEHDGWRFEDWEHASRRYTYRFIWCCRAIVWAIAKFDEHVALMGAEKVSV